MVPGAFVTLERLPLTPNGKLDRRALPDPGHHRPELESPFVAPRSALERTIAAAWSAVLGIERIGLDDAFFDLGGSSLGLLRVASRLRDALGREVRVVDLLRFPTVRSLARSLDGGEAGPAAPRQGEQMLEGRDRLTRLLRQRAAGGR
jgi:acyl carrier protein